MVQCRLHKVYHVNHFEVYSLLVLSTFTYYCTVITTIYLQNLSHLVRLIALCAFVFLSDIVELTTALWQG